MEELKIWLVKAEAFYEFEVVEFLVAANSAKDAEMSVRGESGDMVMPFSIQRHGAWMPDGSGGEFWAWAQDFRFDDMVTAAWAAEGRPYPG